MKTQKNKILAFAIAIFFLLSTMASIALVPNADAHTPPWQIPTWAYLNVSPNPVGVGQAVNVIMWVDKVAPTAIGLNENTTTVNGDVLYNFTLAITAPDGTVTTAGPFTSDFSAARAYLFTPSALGNYTFVFHFGGTTILGLNAPVGGFTAATAAYIGDYFEPSTSAPVTLSVTSTPIPYYPSNPLPTSYWTRPIDASGNLGWSSISGNWLGLAVSEAQTGAYNNLECFNPYTSAPTTAHILWTKETSPGGVIGGEFGSYGESGGSYFGDSFTDSHFSPVIMNGILYYDNIVESAYNSAGWSALNLQTGQSVWAQTPPYTNIAAVAGATTAQSGGTASPNELIKNGQILIFHTVSQYGGQAYLWGTVGSTYSLYDPMYGDWILNVTGATMGTLAEDSQGNILDYFVNSTAGTQVVNGVPVTTTGPALEMWNSTLSLIQYTIATHPSGTTLTAIRGILPVGANIPFSYGIQWEQQLPTNNSAQGIGTFGTLSISRVDTGATSSTPASAISTPIVLMTYSSPSTFSNWNLGWRIEAGFNAFTGAQVWITNRTIPTWSNTPIECAQDGMYAEVCIETGGWSMYSMTTGQQIWGPIVSPVWSQWDSESATSGAIAHGALIGVGLGGDVTSFNATNGNVIWTWTTSPSGTETVYGNWPLWAGSATSRWTIAGGELFLEGGHEYNVPLFQGAQLYCLNETTGQIVWTDLGFDVQTAPAVSDGIMVDYNSYDMSVYAYGQGPSKTTATAPDVGVTTSTPITITGSVTDISAGSLQNAVAANFPNGLPCVSDASMTQWMEYVYQQQPLPNNVTGVPVTLSVLDSNGNYRTIGTTTTNAQGTYGLTWTPDISGKYTVYAVFAGTGGYYGSSASTCFYAGSPPATPAPTAAPLSGLASTSTVMLGVAAIIVVIIIIGAAILLVLTRKRP